MTGVAPLDEGAFRSMVARAPYGVVVHANSRIEFANDAAARMAGFARGEDLVGRPIGDLFAPPYLKGVREALVGSEGQGPVVAVRDDMLHADGRKIPVEVAAIPYLADPDHLAVQMIFHDISARLEAEAAAARSDAYLRVLVAQVPVVLWTANTEGDVTWWHGPTVVAHHPTTGREVGAVLGVDDTAALAQAQQRGLAGVPTSFEVAGLGRSMAVYMEPLRAADGKTITGTVGVALDNTEQKRLEGRRREEQRLDAVAHLAGGVAHEMNNILGTVMAFATVLRDEEPVERRRDDLDAIMAATERGNRVTADLLGFSRGGMYRRVPISAGVLMADAAARFRRHRRPDVRVDIDLPEISLSIEGDPKQLALALDHLTENAVRAMPRGGVITLSASRVTLAESDVPSPDACPGDYVAFRIADTGTGMSDEVRERAFEPYFTTLGAEGRGLGLSMVHGVARRHDGFVSLQSQPGVGTIATLHLPVVERQAPTPRAPVPNTAARGFRGTVLVIDDDDAFRRAMRRVLEHAGFAVTEASNGSTALDLFAAQPSAWRFIVLDLRMPTMSGAEVLRALRAIDPDVGVILCSGYDRDHLTQELFSLGRVGFLPKPFSIDDLEAEILGLASGYTFE